MKRDPNHILAAVLILGAIVIVTIAGGIVVLRRETPRATSSFASQTAGKRSESHYFNIGLEDWQLGSASYVMHIAQPKPVGITGIQGFASAGPLPGANLNSGLVRQTLDCRGFGTSNLVGLVDEVNNQGVIRQTYRGRERNLYRYLLCLCIYLLYV